MSTPGWFQKSERFLESARLLLAAGDPDSAASRAYYAMFHAAEALLLSRQLEYSSHRALLSAFSREFIRSGELPREMAPFLTEAFSARHEGDYFSDTGVDSGDAARQIEHAQQFVAAAARYLGVCGNEPGSSNPPPVG